MTIIGAKWVNVSSGTGSPGCPRESPESCKMVVVVVVVVVLLNSDFRVMVMDVELMKKRQLHTQKRF